MKRLTKQAAARRRLQKLASVAKIVKYDRAMKKMAATPVDTLRPTPDSVARRLMGDRDAPMMYESDIQTAMDALNAARQRNANSISPPSSDGALRYTDNYTVSPNPGWQHYAGLAASGLLEAARPMGGIGKALVPLGLEAYGAPDHVVTNSMAPGIGPLYGASEFARHVGGDIADWAKRQQKSLSKPTDPSAPSALGTPVNKPKGRNLLKKKLGGYKRAWDLQSMWGVKKPQENYWKQPPKGPAPPAAQAPTRKAYVGGAPKAIPRKDVSVPTK